VDAVLYGAQYWEDSEVWFYLGKGIGQTETFKTTNRNTEKASGNSTKQNIHTARCFSNFKTDSNRKNIFPTTLFRQILWYMFDKMRKMVSFE
jgi:hypothetical protein